jgi:hypothetical protein
MADREYAGLLSFPATARGVRDQLRRGFQSEYPPHRPPAGVAHPNDDPRFQKTNERTQMFFGAGVNPARENDSGHRPFLDAEDRVRQDNRSIGIAL